jgi:chromosome segregation ATPase
LLGTIFAFIIAFNRLSTSSPQQQHVYDQAILIVPLGAALWSSFTGVGFAFIVLPPVHKIFTRLLGVKPQRETNAHEIASLSNTLAFFGTTTGATTQALQHMLERTSAINQLLSSFAGSEARQMVNELVAGVSALVKVMAGIAESQSQLTNAVSVLGRGAAELRAEIQATRAPLSAINQALAQSAAQGEETRKMLSALQQSVAENNTASRETATRLAALDRRMSELSGTAAKLQAEMNAMASVMRQLTLTGAVRRQRYRWWHALGFWRKDQQES